jgi:hypothetical protein
MRNRLLSLRHDERGITFVLVSTGFMAFMAATTLAIDVGMIMTARSQAQNAADAGALAGAVALVFNDPADHSGGGAIVQGALSSAVANQVMHGPVSVTPADVTFPDGPGGPGTRVQVGVFRTSARNNPIPTLIGPMFGVPTVDVTAAATAEVVPANEATCVAPLAIPDKWTERQTPAWDTGDTFNAFPSNPSVQPDIYHPASAANYTGYSSTADKGLQLTLSAFSGTNVTANSYFALRLQGSSGAADLQSNVSHCNNALLHFFDVLTNEPGNMTAAIAQGMQDVIAEDPGAYWDAATNRVVSSMNPSPRIKLVPVLDPLYWNQGKVLGQLTHVKAANFIGVFIESVVGSTITGRITPVTVATLDSGAAAAPSGAFAKVIRLVQ